MKMKYFYACNAKDFWFGWLPAEKNLADIKIQLQIAIPKWKLLGLDSPIREGPFMAGLPGNDEYLLAVKEENNGNTYYASPVPLDFLESYDFIYTDPRTELLDKTESPMERKLLETIFNKYPGSFYDSFYEFTPQGNLTLEIEPQYKVNTPSGNYRLDFLVRANKSKIWMFAIEIDGKDYHNSTKQINRDYEREKILMGSGFIILRFSGQDIYHNCSLVVTKIIHAVQMESSEVKHDSTI
jgi:very-short-patch-repair endonuclease